MVMLSKSSKDSLYSIINFIIESDEYKNCIRLKKKMSSNREICDLTNKVKSLQKKYVRSGYDDAIKKELDSTLEKLENIPIYVIYNQNLEIVNNMISTVNEEVNAYFFDKFNKSIEF